MYLEPVLREKRMPSTSLDVRRADVSLDYVERAREIAPFVFLWGPEVVEAVTEETQLNWWTAV